MFRKTALALYTSLLSAALLTGCASPDSTASMFRSGATAADYENDKRICMQSLFMDHNSVIDTSAVFAEVMLGSPQTKACMERLGWTTMAAPDSEQPRFGILSSEQMVLLFVPAGSPADKAGLQVCDKIVAVNGTNILYYEDLVKNISGVTRPIKLTIIRQSEQFDYVLAPEVYRDEVVGEELLKAQTENFEICGGR